MRQKVEILINYYIFLAFLSIRKTVIHYLHVGAPLVVYRCQALDFAALIQLICDVHMMYSNVNTSNMAENWNHDHNLKKLANVL